MYSRSQLLGLRVADAEAGGLMVTSITPGVVDYSPTEFDAILASAVAAGELPPKRCRQQCSVEALRAALFAALRAGFLHVVYFLQPESAVFRAGAPAVDAATLTLWLGECLEHVEAVRWLLEKGADLGRYVEAADLRAVRALRELGSFHPALLTLVAKRGKEAVAQKALEALAACGDGHQAEVLPALVQLLGDATRAYPTRVRAALSVGAICTDASVILDSALLKHPDESCRSLALFTLGEIGDREAAGVLVEYLDSELCLAAVRALAKCGMRGDEGAESLASLCRNASPDVREAACDVLGQLGCARHATVVAELLEDPVAEVRQAAEQALLVIL